MCYDGYDDTKACSLKKLDKCLKDFGGCNTCVDVSYSCTDVNGGCLHLTTGAPRLWVQSPNPSKSQAHVAGDNN